MPLYNITVATKEGVKIESVEADKCHVLPSGQLIFLRVPNVFPNQKNKEPEMIQGYNSGFWYSFEESFLKGKGLEL